MDSRKQKLSLIFSILLFIVFVYMAWQAAQFAELASFFPLYVSVIASVLTLVDILLKIRSLITYKENKEQNNENILAAMKYVLWIIGYLLLIYILGFIISSIIFLLLFLFFESKFSLLKTILSTTIVISGVIMFGKIMTLYWPKGILSKFLGI